MSKVQDKEDFDLLAIRVIDKIATKEQINALNALVASDDNLAKRFEMLHGGNEFINSITEPDLELAKLSQGEITKLAKQCIDIVRDKKAPSITPPVQVDFSVTTRKEALAIAASAALVLSLKEIDRHKDKFLKKYNSQKSVEKALSLSIKAALGHNSLWRQGASIKDKLPAKEFWKDELQALIEKYKKTQTVMEYESDISRLKDKMNGKFNHLFRGEIHPIYKTDPGFRISHSQKSISVFLKHLWCMGAVAEPPQCPVDRVILTYAGLRQPENKWGYVNSIEVHQKLISHLRSKAKKASLSLAKWELSLFG